MIILALKSTKMQYIEVFYSMVKDQDTVSWCTRKTGLMRENGWTICDMVRVLKGIKTKTSMKEISNVAKHMVKESILGLMEKSMMESGKME